MSVRSSAFTSPRRPFPVRAHLFPCYGRIVSLIRPIYFPVDLPVRFRLGAPAVLHKLLKWNVFLMPNQLESAAILPFFAP